MTDYLRSGGCEFDGKNNPTDCDYNMAAGHTISFNLMMLDSKTGEVLTRSPSKDATI